MENKINLFIWRISDLLYLGWIILMSKNSLWQSHFESHLPTLTMFDNFSETLDFCTQTVVVQRFWKQHVF